MSPPNLVFSVAAVVRLLLVAIALAFGLGNALADTRVEAEHADVDVAIITVIDAEYRAVLRQLGEHRPVPATPATPNLFAWRLADVESSSHGRPSRVVVALAGEAGTTSGALATIATARRFRPRYLLLVGIAGGLPERVARGDVVVSEAIWGFEYGHIDSEFVPRHDWTFRGDEALLRAAAGLAIDWQDDIDVEPPARGVRPRLVVGVTASGNKVVEDLSSAFVKIVLRSNPQVISVEMEGAGAAAASELLHASPLPPGMLMIRGISDIPASNREPVIPGSKDDRELWKNYAASAAASFAVNLVRHRLPQAARPAVDAPADLVILSFNPQSHDAVVARLEGKETGRYNALKWTRGNIASELYATEYSAVALLAEGESDPNGVAREALARWRPRFVLIVDTGLGIGKSQPGDVVVGRMAWAFEENDGELVPHRERSYRASRALLAAAIGLDEGWRSGLKPEPRATEIVAGAIASSARSLRPEEKALIEKIAAANGRTVAIDRETAAVAAALAERRVGTLLSVQGISEAAGSDLNASRAAVDAATAFAFHLVRRAWPVPPRR